MTTQEQRAAWRELAAAATPGEWTAAEAWNGDESYYVFVKDGRALLDTYVSLSDADAAFIAAARAAVPQLLADVDALTQERDTLAAELARVRGEAAQREAAENRMFDGLEQMLNQDDVDNDAYNDYVYNAIGRRD